MELIAPLSDICIAQRSYDLFHVVMQTPLSPAYSQGNKWEASRLTMHGAYKWDKFLPWVENPGDILTFLDHHFDLANRGENWDEPIQNALRALGYASGPATIEALKRFDPTQPSFAPGICYVFQGDRPLELRKPALFFLPLIGDGWFSTPRRNMRDDQMRSFCVDWASTVDAIEHSDDVQKVTLAALFGMINSPHWRPHIVLDKWNLLEYFPSVPDDSQPLRRCLDNPELIDAIRNVANPAATTLWMKILWLKYKELIPAVREQLETVTKEVAQGGGVADLETCQSAIEFELTAAGHEMAQYPTWSANPGPIVFRERVRRPTWSDDPAPVALRAKIENLQEAKQTLFSLKGG